MINNLRVGFVQGGGYTCTGDNVITHRSFQLVCDSFVDGASSFSAISCGVMHLNTGNV